LQGALRKRAPYYTASTQLRERIRSSVRRASRAEAPAPRRFFWPRPGAWLGLAASAAVIALVIWAGAPRLWRPSAEELLAQQVVSSHVRSLLADHLTDVRSSDQHTVKPWFNGKLDFSPPVEDFAAHGFPLLGGRLDYLNERPVAALVYQHRQHYLNVFLWPASEGADQTERTRTRQGYNMFSWSRSGMNYWLISDLNQSELHEFANLLRK